MKTKIFFSLFLLIIISFTSCTSQRYYIKNTEKVNMNYAVYISHNDIDEGYILCNDYRMNVDTIWLFNSGYSSYKMNQTYTADIIFCGKDYSWHIIKLK
jgi:hypothetical protein